MHILHLSDTPVNCSVFANITEVSSALCVKDTFETYGQCRFCNGNVPICEFYEKYTADLFTKEKKKRKPGITTDMTKG